MKLSPLPLSGTFVLLAFLAAPGSATAYPGAPSPWGTWTEDVYLGLSPRQISATSDPDGRLRAAFINGRALPSSNKTPGSHAFLLPEVSFLPGTDNRYFEKRPARRQPLLELY